MEALTLRLSEEGHSGLRQLAERRKANVNKAPG